MTYPDFDSYLRSLDHLVMVGEPEGERIEAAYHAGLGRRELPPGLISPSPYLFDRLREAFSLGQRGR